MRYCGKIGFAVTVEVEPDVWVPQITERTYYGDIVKNFKVNEPTETLNDNINIRNSFSIVADPYAYNHFFDLRYIWWMGTRWEVKTVDVQRPRLIITVGGVYNGPTPDGPVGDASTDTGE